MGKKKRRRKQSNKLGIYIAIILVFVIIALIEFGLKKGSEPQYKYTYNPTTKYESTSSVETYEESSPIQEDVTTSLKSSDVVVLKEGLEIPICGVVAKRLDHELRKFQNYSLCYRETYEQAEWSAYSLTANQLIKNADRTNDFRPDNRISTQSASLADYKGSGYDRGHLTPAADMSFSEQAMSETFFMSNMSPQEPQFNRGIWMYLEAQVRKWAERFGRVYVVSGPILDKSADKYKTIGNNKVVVPELYYKVILVPLYEDSNDFDTPNDSKSVMAIGFIIPNRKCDDSFWNYATSIDNVENMTGLDFFALLDDDIENYIESTYVLSNWK